MLLAPRTRPAAVSAPQSLAAAAPLALLLAWHRAAPCLAQADQPFRPFCVLSSPDSCEGNQHMFSEAPGDTSSASGAIVGTDSWDQYTVSSTYVPFDIDADGDDDLFASFYTGAIAFFRTGG